jgi:hypothetical protein
MSNTENKLFEAKYFFERMLEYQTQHIPFKHNLSAFLAAFRSVTFFMQKEYSKAENFLPWYKIQQKQLETNDKMKLLNEKRVMTIHSLPVEPKAQIHVSVHDYLCITEEITFEIIHANGTIEKETSITTEQPELPEEIIIDDQWLWYFDDYPSSDIISVCKECLISLEYITSECESKFSSTLK